MGPSSLWGYGNSTACKSYVRKLGGAINGQPGRKHESLLGAEDAHRSKPRKGAIAERPLRDGGQSSLKSGGEGSGYGGMCLNGTQKERRG